MPMDLEEVIKELYASVLSAKDDPDMLIMAQHLGSTTSPYHVDLLRRIDGVRMAMTVLKDYVDRTIPSP